MADEDNAAGAAAGGKPPPPPPGGPGGGGGRGGGGGGGRGGGGGGRGGGRGGPPTDRSPAGAALPLTEMVDASVLVLTNDGRAVVGTLRGYDQATNLALEDCHERVFSAAQGVERVPLGLYFVRGDNVAVVGAVDEAADAAVDWGSVRAAPLPPITH